MFETYRTNNTVLTSNMMMHRSAAWHAAATLLLLVLACGSLTAECHRGRSLLAPPAGQCHHKSPGCPVHTTGADANHVYCLGDFSKTCKSDINKGCNPCYLWTAPCATGRCYTEGSYVIRHGDGTEHTLVLPSADIRGIEDWQQVGESIWAAAWHVGVKGGAVSTAIPASDVGIVINAVNTRTEHQMHLHVAKLASSIRSQLNEKTVKTSPAWTNLSVTGGKLSCTFIATKTPPSTVKPFGLVAAHEGYPPLPKYGILVAGSGLTDTDKGYYVCAMLDGLNDHYVLNY